MKANTDCVFLCHRGAHRLASQPDMAVCGVLGLPPIAKGSKSPLYTTAAGAYTCVRLLALPCRCVVQVRAVNAWAVNAEHGNVHAALLHLPMRARVPGFVLLFAWQGTCLGPQGVLDVFDCCESKQAAPFFALQLVV